MAPSAYLLGAFSFALKVSPTPDHLGAEDQASDGSRSFLWQRNQIRFDFVKIFGVQERTAPAGNWIADCSGRDPSLSPPSPSVRKVSS